MLKFPRMASSCSAAVPPCAVLWLPPGGPAALVAAARLGLRALLPTRASTCCWDPARTGTVSLALLAQRSLTWTHKNRTEKGPNKSNTSQRIETKSTAPRSRGGKGLLSYGSKVQFYIQKTLTLGEEGRGTRRTKENRRGRRELVREGVGFPLLSF